MRALTEYNTLNIKLSNSQLNKLKSRIKNGTEITLNLLSNEIDDSNDKANFLDELLKTDKFQSSSSKLAADARIHKKVL